MLCVGYLLYLVDKNGSGFNFPKDSFKLLDFCLWN